jgi:single-strand DNA-binding protein
MGARFLMAGETIITVVGNLTDDAELRFTPNGAAVAKFTIASTPRILDRQSGEWKDGDPMFLRCDAWRDLAEHIAETLTKGMRVVAQGRLKMRQYEKDGQKRTVFEMEVDEIGPSLRYATAAVTRTPKSGAPADSRSGGYGGSGSSPVKTSNFDDEPPF